MRSGAVPRRGLVIAVAAVAVVLLLAVVAEALASAGRVHPGVSVAGVDVGGLSQSSARLRIQRQLSARMKASPVVFKLGEQSWKVAAAGAGASVDASSLASDAMEVGRSGGLLVSLGDRARAWVDPIDLPAHAHIDETKTAAFLTKLDGDVAVQPKDAVIKIKGVKMALQPSSKGQALDRTRAQALLTAGLLSKVRVFEVPTAVVDPAIDDTEAAAAMKVARAFLAAPATVTRGTKTWRFSPAELASWTSFRPVGKTGEERLEAYIDPAALTDATKGSFGKLGKAPQNAQFKVDNGRVTIVPSKDGVGPDISALASDLTSALAQAEGPRSVELRIGRAAPSLTTDEARTYGIKERLATYTTTYGPSNKPRVNNIHLLASSLNGKLIPPGGQFSFNGAVGQRTAEKGYQEANAIVAGKLVPQLGGGICQVCTTLFNTVFFSGLPVDQRVNHAFYISHYPAGRDATVSWGGPDFKFTNTTGHWLLLATSFTNSSVTVSLYGTDPRYDVSYANGPWTNIRPFKIETVKDPSLPAGSKFVEDAGVDGRSMIVTRTVKKDGKVIRVDRFVSNYAPKSATVKVGTKPLPSKAATSTPRP
jgi:vancomycin resistance protein YoaR